MRRGAGLLVLLVPAALLAGIWLGGHPGSLPALVRDNLVDDPAALTAEAIEAIDRNYFRDVEESRLVNPSIDGIVRALRKRYRDRFSEYLSPRRLARFNEAISGHFSGIGLTVSETKRGLRAEHVFARSPAARAGIAGGDVIVAVEGRSIAGVDSEVATARIKGPEGTRVRLRVLRPSTGRAREVVLTRAQIDIPVTTSGIREAGGRRLGYVRLFAFTEGAHGALRQAIRRVERRGAEGLLLDLRANGGGLLEEAVLAASLFVPEGDVVVTTESRTQGQAVYRAVGGMLPKRPTVVLIDGSTASAAEILTAVLRDEAGATVVGRRSFGKGVFQQEVLLSNGGALKLTIGEYFTPDGENLAGTGIAPSVRARDVPRTPADEAVRRALGVLARDLGRGGDASAG